MEPSEYCKYWVAPSHHPGRYAYRAACIKALVEASFGQYKASTINDNWGTDFENRPDKVLGLLRAAHYIRLAEVHMERSQQDMAKAANSVHNAMDALRRSQQRRP